MFDTVLGLPAHILVIHGAVVVIPLAALASALVAALPYLPARYRASALWVRRYGVGVVVLDALALGLAWLAAETGEAFLERIGSADEAVVRHTELGSSMKWFTLGVLVLTAVYVFRLRDRGAVTAVAALLVLASALASTVWVAQVGHSGSSAVWRSVVESPRGPG